MADRRCLVELRFLPNDICYSTSPQRIVAIASKVSNKVLLVRRLYIHLREILLNLFCLVRECRLNVPDWLLVQ